MPHASLLVMTSPMLLAPLPAAGMGEVGIAAPPTIAVEATLDTPSNSTGSSLLSLSWSLVDGQDQPAGPQDEGSPPESGTEQPAETEIVVQGEYGPTESGPMAAVNETSFRITQDVDNALVEPLAYAYRDGLPGPLRDGVGNVIRNLREPVNFLNFLLQFKVGKAFETLGRFAINSTLGLGGLIDVAEKPGIGLPYRRNGFANTMGFYGVDTGAYLFLPIAGATTVRDLIGNTLDQAVLPLAVGAPFDRPEYTIPYFVISNLDSRLEFDAELEVLDSTIDPYAARRDTYLARRARDIALLRGEEPPEPPEILRELEAELDGRPLDDDDADYTAPETDAAPPISARELPPIAVAVTVTRPQTR